MSGLFGSPAQESRSMVPAAAAAQPTDAPRRADTGADAADQVGRFTRRRGRALTMLTGGAATGGMTAARMLGSAART